MKFTSILPTLIILLFTTTTFCQKSKTDKITIPYVSLPSKKLPEHFKTYSVEASGDAIYVAGSDPHSFARSIKMDGFTRVDDKGDLAVSIKTGSIYIGDPTPKSEVKTSKDKNGKETKTTYYWYQFPLATTISYKIVDAQGKTQSYYTQPIKSELSSEKYTSAKERYNNYHAIVASTKKNFATNAINTLKKKVQGTLSYQFDFKNRRYYANLFFIKKHETEQVSKEAIKICKETFSKLRPTFSPEAVKPSVEKAISFWEAQAAKETKNDKKKILIRQAVNYNLAVVHFLLDDLEKAKKHVNVVLETNNKDKKSKKLLAHIKRTQKLMELHGIFTMHHQRDLSK